MLLQVKNLRKNFGMTQAVKGIDFSIEKGRCVALLGPNGAGKTTTLQILAGLSTQTDGEIILHGSNGEDRRNHIGFLPQYPNFFEWMTPLELLKFTGDLSQLDNKLLKNKIEETLETVGLQGVAKRRIGGFSGGMKQRLGLAQALLHRPKLLLLDEPVSSLDPLGRREVMGLLHELKEETTIFFSTHVLHDAEEISDDVLIMKNGEIKVAKSLQDLKKNDETVILKIKTAEKIADWLPEVTEVSNVFNETPYLAQLTVSTIRIEHIKRLLLARILEKSVTLERFEVTESTLEDLFLKVVAD